MDGKAVWAASGSDVIKYLRGKENARLSNPLGSTLSSFIIFGNQLLALTEDGKRMLVWDTAEGGKSINRLSISHILKLEIVLQSTIEFDANFTATTLLHPATYLNKVLVGSSQGSLQLWNIRTQSVYPSLVTPL